jgi:hypothetical protein
VNLGFFLKDAIGFNPLTYIFLLDLIVSVAVDDSSFAWNCCFVMGFTFLPLFKI